MSVVIVARWTCDRCGSMAQTTEAELSPAGWTRLFTVSPPSESDVGSPSELCGPCSQQLVDWLANRHLRAIQ